MLLDSTSGKLVISFIYLDKSTIEQIPLSSKLTIEMRSDLLKKDLLSGFSDILVHNVYLRCVLCILYD